MAGYGAGKTVWWSARRYRGLARILIIHRPILRRPLLLSRFHGHVKMALAIINNPFHLFLRLPLSRNLRDLNWHLLEVYEVTWGDLHWRLLHYYDRGAKEHSNISVLASLEEDLPQGFPELQAVLYWWRKVKVMVRYSHRLFYDWGDALSLLYFYHADSSSKG